MSAVALAVFLEQLLDILGILCDALLIAVVTVDEHEEVTGGEFHLRALVVAGGCSHTALGIAIYGQTVDVYHSASDALVRLPLASYAKGQGVADELVGIEAPDAVTEGYRGKVDEVNERVSLVQLLALQHAAYQGFGGRAVA